MHQARSGGHYLECSHTSMTSCILVNLSRLQRGTTFIREFMTKIGKCMCACAEETTLNFLPACRVSVSLVPRPSRAPAQKRVWYITSRFLVVLSQHAYGNFVM